MMLPQPSTLSNQAVFSLYTAGLIPSLFSMAWERGQYTAGCEQVYPPTHTYCVQPAPC